MQTTNFSDDISADRSGKEKKELKPRDFVYPTDILLSGGVIKKNFDDYDSALNFILDDHHNYELAIQPIPRYTMTLLEPNEWYFGYDEESLARVLPALIYE